MGRQLDPGGRPAGRELMRSCGEAGAESSPDSGGRPRRGEGAQRREGTTTLLPHVEEFCVNCIKWPEAPFPIIYQLFELSAVVAATLLVPT